MRPVTLVPVLLADAEVVDFGPFVPSVNDDGAVAFTAVLADGGTALFLGDPHRVQRVDPGARGPVERFTSHPDVDARGTLVVYATLLDGRRALVRVEGSVVEVLAATGDGFVDIAPTGPTMNDSGAAAFRAVRDGTGPGCYLFGDGAVRAVAESGALAGFDGLPVVNARDEVVVRAVRGDGSGVVLSWRQGRSQVVFDQSEHGELGRFPCCTDEGAVGIAAAPPGGGWTYLVAREGQVREAFPPGRYGHVRGGLLVNGGLLAAYVTPTGGGLTVLAGPDPQHDRLVAIGDPLLGSRVVDMALNPVSGSNAGWLAVRVTMEDGRSGIFRSSRTIEPWGLPS